MALQPLSIGDILMLSQTAWKIGRAFSQGRKSAPSEFAEVEREASGLSEALKLVAEALYADGSILSQADADTKYAVNTILESAHKTLDDLESFVDRYQVIRKKETGHGFVVERSWAEAVLANYKKFKWTTEGGDIIALRDMLHMHTNSINLTMQALQSRSLSRLEKTVMPMAENIVSIHERVNGDLGSKIDDMHNIIMTIASNTPSLVAQDRMIEPGSVRDSTSTASTYESSSSPRIDSKMLEPPPPRSTSLLTPRHLSRSPLESSKDVAGKQAASSSSAKSRREDSAYGSPGRTFYYDQHDRIMDWNFETGSPTHRPSIAAHAANQNAAGAGASPSDSAYTESSSRRTSTRRESATLPALFKAVSEQYKADSADISPELSPDDIPPVPRKSSKRPDYSPTSVGASPNDDLLPPPAVHVDNGERPQTPATPTSVFARLQRSKSSPDDRPQTANSAPVRPPPRSAHRNTMAAEPKSLASETPKFERQLFRNAAILCDVRGKLVEYARFNPEISDPRYNIEMKEACKEARICVIRKRENREHGGTKVVTSIWCLSDEGDIRLQHKLSDVKETVPYCSYFEPEKVSLQPDGDPEIALKFHPEEWGHLLREEKRTNWVNYYFLSENDAVAFQSAIFGRMLIGSFRTTKTTVIHEGIKGAFAFEEQFAGIEMLRLWEDDGVETAGAAGGVMALMHISSNFGEGWARWWINNSKQPVKIKEDGAKHAKVKGIDVTVLRPGAGARAQQAEITRQASWVGEELSKLPQAKVPALKRVGGVRIEFKTEEERGRFVGVAKRFQERCVPLPEFE